MSAETTGENLPKTDDETLLHVGEITLDKIVRLASMEPVFSESVNPNLYLLIEGSDTLEYRVLPYFSEQVRKNVYETTKLQLEYASQTTAAIIAIDKFAQRPQQRLLMPKGLVAKHLVDYYRDPLHHPGSHDTVHRRTLWETFDTYSAIAQQKMNIYPEITLVDRIYEELGDRHNHQAVAGVEALYVAYGMTVHSLDATRNAVKQARIDKEAIQNNWKRGYLRLDSPK